MVETVGAGTPEVKKGTSVGTATTVRMYGYDESDNRITVDFQDLSPQEVHTFAYNKNDELTSRSVAVGGGSSDLVESFSHDNDGNMITRVLDPNGTPTTTKYYWDDFDRLAAVEKPDGTTVNVYDSGNLRKKKVRDDGVKLKSFYSGLPTVSEVDGSDVFSYLMGHQLLGFQKGSDFYYFLTDGLSSVRVMVKASNGATSNFLHDEWGVKDPSSDSDSPYVGGLGVHDDTADTGLLYMRQRHYDPTLARFLSRDRVANLNRYAYVDSSPLSRVDPTGLDGLSTAIAVGRALAPIARAGEAGVDTFIAAPGPPQAKLGAALLAFAYALGLGALASGPPTNGSVSPDPSDRRGDGWIRSLQSKDWLDCPEPDPMDPEPDVLYRHPKGWEGPSRLQNQANEGYKFYGVFGPSATTKPLPGWEDDMAITTRGRLEAAGFRVVKRALPFTTPSTSAPIPQ
ncbi:MAG: RHS repeat domain-containing protein [Vulcanimicrobiota bacterium]